MNTVLVREDDDPEVENAWSKVALQRRITRAAACLALLAAGGI
jgi:hypothetical protein